MSDEKQIKLRGQLGEESSGFFGLFGGGSRQDGGTSGRNGAGQKAPTNTRIDPMAGFWNRAAAGAIDLLLLHFTARLWFPAALPFFLDHPGLLPLTAIAIWLLYFALANGPLGKGQTVGKKLLGITTRKLDGTPLDWAGAFLRAAVQVGPLFVVAFRWDLQMAFAEPGPGEIEMGLWIRALLLVPAFVFMLANLTMMVTRGDKRAIHDMAAGSFTYKNSEREQALAAIASVPRGAFNRAIQIVAIISLLMLVVFEYNSLASRKLERQFGVIAGDLWERFGMEGYDLGMSPHIIAEFPAPAAVAAEQGGATTDSATMNGEAPDKADQAASPSAPSREPRRQWLCPVAFYRRGKVDDEALTATIAEENLTTAVAHWLDAQRDREPMKSSLEAMRKSPVKPARYEIDIMYLERLGLPILFGPFHVRKIQRQSFFFPVSKEEE